MRFQSFQSFEIIIAVIVGLLLISVMVAWLSRARGTNTSMIACASFNGTVVPMTYGGQTYYVCCKNGQWVGGIITNSKGNPVSSVTPGLIKQAKSVCLSSAKGVTKTKS